MNEIIYVFIVLLAVFSILVLPYAWIDAQDKIDEVIRLEKRYKEKEG